MQADALARQTDSFVTDADGVHRPLYLEWYTGDFLERLTELVSRVLGGVRFEQVSAEVVIDRLGITRGIDPSVFGPVEAGQFGDPKSFRLELDAGEQRTDHWLLEPLEVRMVGDGGVELARRTLFVAVPPRQ